MTTLPLGVIFLFCISHVAGADGDGISNGQPGMQQQMQPQQMQPQQMQPQQMQPQQMQPQVIPQGTQQSMPATTQPTGNFPPNFGTIPSQTQPNTFPQQQQQSPPYPMVGQMPQPISQFQPPSTSSNMIPQNNNFQPGGVFPGQGQGMLPNSQMNAGNNQRPFQQQTMPGTSYPNQSGNQWGQQTYVPNLQLNGNEAQLGFQWVMSKFSQMLNDPTSRDNLINLFNYLPNWLSHPNFGGWLQATNSRILNTLNNPQLYNDYIHQYPMNQNNGHQTPTLIQTTTGSPAGGIFDMIGKKKAVVGSMLRNTASDVSKGINGLFGDIPVVSSVVRMGTGAMDQAMGSLDAFTPGNNNAGTNVANPPLRTNSNIYQPMMPQQFPQGGEYRRNGSG